MWRVYFSQIQQDPRFGPMLTRAKPGFPLAAAIAVGALVVVIPLVLLALAGLIVGVATYIVLRVLSQLIDAVRSLFSRSRPPASDVDGRRNVRVID